MTTTATNVIAIAKERFRDSIATTTAFRTWEGNSWTVQQAMTRIYYDALPPPAADSHTLAELMALRPYCLVYKPPDFGVTLRHSANGPHFRFTPSGVLIARFERDVPVAQQSDPGEADRIFENMMGALLSSGDVNSPGLVELAGMAGYLAITRIDEAGPYRSLEDEQPTIGDCQWYFLQVEWGVKG